MASGTVTASATGLPPGPTGSPLWQTLKWVLRPVAFIEACRRRYGEAFSLSFLGFERPMVMVSDPDAVRALYAGRENGLPPGRKFSLGPLLGERSVLLLEGEEHLARRKLMLPAFHGERMRAYEEVIAAATHREIDSWPVGTPFALHPGMQRITLEVILRAVFGVVDPRRRDELTERLPKLLGRFSSPGVQLASIVARRFGRDPADALRREVGPIDALLLEEIAERRADPRLGDHDDVLAQLVQARFEDGSAMSDGELRDQLLTLLVAGHETTATGLAWTWEMLLRHPAALARLREEIAAGEGERYLRSVVTEALRLRPVVPLAGRRITHPMEVGGHELPAGTDVTASIWLAHTRADTYPEPYAFRPERFLDGSPETYSWVPFGGGVRRCLGAAFAELEMRVAVREIARRCELEVASGKPERIASRNVTITPGRGTRVILRART